MIYALMSMISFVAIYALLGGPALTINSWLGDRDQFIEPGLSASGKRILGARVSEEPGGLRSQGV